MARWPKEGEYVPDGFWDLEADCAYSDGKEIVVIGCPHEDDDHDCDLMGCGMLSHVVAIGHVNMVNKPQSR